MSGAQETAPVTRQRIAEGLRALGLRAGMACMVHSSLKSFGWVEGGADTVIDALMDVLTPEGTLLMPSFNHGAPYDRGDIFDIRVTPTTNGRIPDTFWRRPDVVRSLNPTHAFAAWGRNARRYTENHHCVDAMGRGSPLALLYEDDGYGLLLGVDYHSNTFHHFVETDIGAPCLSRRGEVYPVRRADGTVVSAHTWGWRNGPCPIDDDALYAAVMEARGLHRRGRVGGSMVTLFRLADCYRVVAECLTHGYGGHPPCAACPVRPRVCQWTVPEP